MNRILIINLRRFGDIFSIAHVVDSIIQKDPGTEIELLVYAEFASAAQILKHIKKIHTIDRKKIISFRQHPALSDALALEELYCAIKPLEKTKWTQVINYSNDPVGTYLTSFFTSCAHIGIRFSDYNVITPSNDWAVIFNDLLPNYTHTPIHFIDCYHEMLQIPRASSGDKIKQHAVYNETARKTISALRQGKENIRVLGIQLKASASDKEISKETIIKLINLILDDPNLLPVLLIAPHRTEKLYASEINQFFDNGLVVIESDFIALPSVLINLDLLITPDTAIKHVADLLEVKMLEVSLGSAPFLKQGTRNPNSLILRNSKQVTASDIINSIKYIFDPRYLSIMSLSENTALYRPEYDDLGVYYNAICGKHDDLAMVKFARHYLKLLLKNSTSVTPAHAPLELLEQEKESIANATKKILEALRLLHHGPANSDISVGLLKSIAALFDYCSTNSLVSIPMTLFRSKLETMPKQTPRENLNITEKLLYQLKDHLLLLLNHIKKAERGNSTQKQIRNPGITICPN